MLTVETEATGDSKSTYERGPSLVCSLGTSCRYNGFLSCLGFNSQTSTKTNNVPVVYIARDIMISMRAASITRAIGKDGP